jgi:hypothetical protein
MGMPVSVRLDDEVRATLEAEARSRRLGLSSYLREIATEEARRLRHERIRRQSRQVAEHVARSPEAAEFYADWGTPRAADG